MSLSNYKDIPITDIIVDEDRARPLDLDWVALLAESIAEQGLLNAITVRPVGEQYKLISGGHRFAAMAMNEAETITCHVREYGDKDGDHIRLEEVTENIVRNELNALDRARSLFELDALYKKLYPELENGGNKQTQLTDANRSAIIALRLELMEKVGLSRRSFFIAIAIWKGLSVASRARAYGTWIASHQASLMSLSGEAPARQKKLLDILFPKSGEPKAKNMPDALTILDDGRLSTDVEKKFRSINSSLKSLSKDEEDVIFDANREAIMAWLSRTEDKK